MITYKAIIEETEKSFKSTRKSEIKKWAKEASFEIIEIKNKSSLKTIYLREV